MIIGYFKSLQETIKTFEHIVIDSFSDEKIYNEYMGFIEGEILFTDESRLDFAEVKDVQRVSKVKYRYHYMNSKDELIFRYDNTKHYPKLPNFPHHKHVGDLVESSHEPGILEILTEIEKMVVKTQ